MINDSELLARYVNDGADEAFTELVRRHINLVYSAALRQLRGDVHHARDVTQIVFTDLARKSATLTGRPELAGWLYISTGYATKQLIRGEVRRQKREREAQSMHDSSESQASTTDWNQVHPVLDEAMHALAPADREAVLLRFFAGYSFADIGQHLNLNEGTARVRVSRALDKLHVQLSRRGIKSTSAALSIGLLAHATMAAPAGFAQAVSGVALAGASSGSVFALTSLFVAAKTPLAIATITVAALVIGILTLPRTAKPTPARIEPPAVQRVIAQATPPRSDAQPASDAAVPVASPSEAQDRRRKAIRDTIAARRQADKSAATSSPEPSVKPKTLGLRPDEVIPKIYMPDADLDTVLDAYGLFTGKTVRIPKIRGGVRPLTVIAYDITVADAIRLMEESLSRQAGITLTAVDDQTVRANIPSTPADMVPSAP